MCKKNLYHSWENFRVKKPYSSNLMNGNYFCFNFIMSLLMSPNPLDPRYQWHYLSSCNDISRLHLNHTSILYFASSVTYWNGLNIFIQAGLTMLANHLPSRFSKQYVREMSKLCSKVINHFRKLTNERNLSVLCTNYVVLLFIQNISPILIG